MTVVNFDDLPADAWVHFNPPGCHWKNGFNVAKPVVDAEYLLWTCCLKTHQFGGVHSMSLKLAVGVTKRKLEIFGNARGHDHNAADDRGAESRFHTAADRHGRRGHICGWRPDDGEAGPGPALSLPGRTASRSMPSGWRSSKITAPTTRSCPKRSSNRNRSRARWSWGWGSGLPIRSRLSRRTRKAAIMPASSRKSSLRGKARRSVGIAAFSGYLRRLPLSPLRGA